MSKFIIFVVGILMAMNGMCEEYKTPEEILKEFSEEGHEKKIKVEYENLNKVIPEAKLKELGAQKKKRKEKKHESSFSLINNAHGFSGGGSKPKPKPTDDNIDLRQFDTPIRSQWNGTCTAHGLIAAMENLMHQTQPNHEMLSTRYFWSLYQKYNAYVAINTAMKNKQVLDKYWPQNSNSPKLSNIGQYANAKLAQNDYLDDNLNAGIADLKNKKPLYIAMSVPEDMATCRSTIRMTTKLTDGGHALAVVGFIRDAKVDGGGYFILKNSWGKDCGDKGYQYLPFGLCERDDMYCVLWSINQVSF